MTNPAADPPPDAEDRALIRAGIALVRTGPWYEGFGNDVGNLMLAVMNESKDLYSPVCQRVGEIAMTILRENEDLG